MNNESQNKEGISQSAINHDRQLPSLDFSSFNSMEVSNCSHEGYDSKTSVNKDMANVLVDSSSNQFNNLSSNTTAFLNQSNPDLNPDNSQSSNDKSTLDFSGIELSKQDQVGNQTIKQEQVVDPNSNLQIDNSANQQLSQQISQQNNDQSLVLSKDLKSDQDPFSNGVPSVDELFGTSTQTKELESQIKLDDKLLANIQTTQQKNYSQTTESISFDATSLNTENNSLDIQNKSKLDATSLNTENNSLDIQTLDIQTLDIQNKSKLDATSLNTENNSLDTQTLDIQNKSKLDATSLNTENNPELEDSKSLAIDKKISLPDSQLLSSQLVLDEAVISSDKNFSQVKEIDKNQVDDPQKIITESQTSLPLQNNELSPIEHQKQIINDLSAQEDQPSQEGKNIQENTENLNLNADTSKDTQDFNTDHGKILDNTIQKKTIIIPSNASTRLPSNREKIVSVILGQDLFQNALSGFNFIDLEKDKNPNKLEGNKTGVFNSDSQTNIKTNDTEVSNKSISNLINTSSPSLILDR